MNNRIERLRSELKTRSLEGIIVSHLPHIQYLSGFSGSAGLLFVGLDRAIFITDFRYQEQMAEQLFPGIEGIVARSGAELLSSEKIIAPGMAIGFQEGFVTLAGFDDLKRRFRKVKLERTGALLQELTMVKTDEEIGYIRKAAAMAGKVYKEILALAKPGMRESEIAAEISYRGKHHGSEGDAFDIIVASGPRGALPHGRASDRKMKKGELVTLDFGFVYKGFNSDMTRTFALGTPSDEARAIHDIVLRAQVKGVRAARAGMSGKELDDVCRDEITTAGYGPEFGHSTGHGLGIEVHEGPGISFRGAEQILRENMVVTIEPGIYLPGRCGVRIEDDVVITATGCTVLTKAPKELIIV